MVNFAEYFSKEWMSQPFSISDTAKMSEGFRNWTDYLIKHDIIPPDLYLQGLPVPNGRLIDSLFLEEYLQDVLIATRELNSEVAIKIQVLKKGRGRAGGIKIVRYDGKPFDINRYCSQVSVAARELHEEYEGPIYQVYVEELIKGAKEFYLSKVTDTSSKKPMIVWGPGGMEVEELEGKLQKIIIDDITNPKESLRKMRGVDGIDIESVRKLALEMYHRSWIFDLSQFEANPLMIAGDVITFADLKLIMSGDAVYRHPEIIERWNKTWKYQPTIAEKREARAKEMGFSYVVLDPTGEIFPDRPGIGCAANGAGLGMVTCDELYAHELNPSNFCDLRGGSTKDKIMQAIWHIASEPGIDGILINVHGGILRVDEVAKAYLAVKNSFDNLPCGLRIIGTNEEIAYAMLKAEGVRAHRDIGPAIEDLKRQIEMRKV